MNLALTAPRGGLHVTEQRVARWRWTGRSERVTEPLRCRAEQWYLVRATPDHIDDLPRSLRVEFIADGRILSSRAVTLQRIADAPDVPHLLGWVLSPVGARHVRLRLDSRHDAGLQEATLLPIAERDPKAHPVANLPFWSTYKPPFPIERLVVPESLAGLAPVLRGVLVEPIKPPRSLRDLAKHAIGAACIVDPAWIESLQLGMSDLDRVIPATWMLLDLETTASLLRRGKLADVETATWRSRHEIMSARVEYADVPTRGLALLDVFPYGTREDEGHYAVRVLRASRSWKKYADDVGFSFILSSQTPWERRCNDVICAARPLGQGELIATDLPWLVAGHHGKLLAPRIAEHLLRMHLGLPCDEWSQFWNRWDDMTLVVRDVADLARRYTPLTPVRWSSDKDGAAQLGISLPIGREPTRRHLVLDSGRIDAGLLSDGLPVEPMSILMKCLARELREQTPWARRYLKDLTITWRFAAHDGLKYVVAYESAAPLADERFRRVRVAHVRGPGHASDWQPPRSESVLLVNQPEGILGDSSIAFQSELARLVRAEIESLAR